MKTSKSLGDRAKKAGLVLALPLLASSLTAQQGHVMNGVGAVNQSMGGAAVGAPIDPSGTINWNPAGISALGCCEFQFGFELFQSDLEISSTFGPMSGSTPSDVGTSPIPSFAFTWGEKDSPWIFGLGAYGMAGFGTNFAASSPSPGGNPIFMPQPNGFGAVYSDFQLLQLAPTVAYRINKQWSVGFSPTIDRAQLSVDPAAFAVPNSNGTYPSAAHADESWGWGFQLGVLWELESGWNLGASYKSTQWFNEFSWNSADENGLPRNLRFQMDFPAIASLGVGYTGIDKWTFAADLRYIDYENTDGFQEAGFSPTGAVTGFGWDSIMVLALGAQWQINDKFSVRGGYSYNDNPISDANTFWNVAAPAIIQHHLSLGASLHLSAGMTLDLAYTHGFSNSISGPMYGPTGAVPGSNVKAEMSTDSLIFGLRVDF